MSKSYYDEIRKEVQINEHFKEHLYNTPFSCTKPVTGYGKCKEIVKAGKNTHSSFFEDFTESDARELICQVLAHPSVTKKALVWLNEETRGVDGTTVAWGGQQEFSVSFAKPIGFCAKIGHDKPIACTRLTVVLERTQHGFKLVTAYPSMSTFGDVEYISSKGHTAPGLLKKLRDSEYYC